MTSLEHCIHAQDLQLTLISLPDGVVVAEALNADLSKNILLLAKLSNYLRDRGACEDVVLLGHKQ